MKPYYFKVKTGFSAEEYISITSDELEKAIYAQITGKVAIFNHGTIRGSNIISIKEDWHKEMGWNQGYELGPEDFSEISQRGRDYRGLIEGVKNKVEYLIQNKKEELIGKNISVPELENKQPQEISEATKILSEKFKI